MNLTPKIERSADSELRVLTVGTDRAKALAVVEAERPSARRRAPARRRRTSQTRPQQPSAGALAPPASFTPTRPGSVRGRKPDPDQLTPLPRAGPTPRRAGA